MQRIDELINLINKYNEEYYGEDNSSISDFEYDSLMKELKEIEEKNPELVRLDSPTRKIGFSAKFSEIKHKYKMESLQDVFSKEELLDFLNKTEIGKSSYVVEYKIDGLSVSLEYDKGKLIMGATRGDGTTGENVLENIYEISCIPKTIKDTRNIIIRGEVYMKRSVFASINKERLEKGQTLLANPRNAAAGSLRQLDRNIVRDRKLSFLAFNFENASDFSFNSHVDALNFLKDLGIPVSPTLNKYENFDDISLEIEDVYKRSKELDFDIDGAVIKIDNLPLRLELGSTSKFPKWAAAFKYPAEEKPTKLLDIIITVGRTGTLTPNAVLEPVRLAGTNVSKATLHNKDFIENLGISIGDTVTVRKAGEIIPEITGVTKKSENSVPFKMPDNCPVCGESVLEDEIEVAIRCVNPQCKAQITGNIEHFASRNAMNIEGLGPSIVSALVENNLIEDASDLYYLKKEDLLNLERFAEKSATNLINEIEKSKENGLSRLLFALGARHVGQKASKILAEHFLNIDALLEKNVEELTEVHEIGEKTAKSLIEFLKNNTEIIEKLKNANVKLTEDAVEKLDIFKGYTFVLTGTLSLFTRKEASDIIEKLGGKTSSSVSKKTSYVVAGEEAGSKLLKAQTLGVKVLTEEQFKEMISGHE